MSKPSSTITASFLAGSGVALFWELISTFFEVELSLGLVSASTVFVSAMVGYLKKENVLGQD